MWQGGGEVVIFIVEVAFVYSDPQKVCVHRPLSLPRYNVH